MKMKKKIKKMLNKKIKFYLKKILLFINSF